MGLFLDAKAFADEAQAPVKAAFAKDGATTPKPFTEGLFVAIMASIAAGLKHVAGRAASVHAQQEKEIRALQDEVDTLRGQVDRLLQQSSATNKRIAALERKAGGHG